MTDDSARNRWKRDAEAFYEALVEAHEGLTLEQCVRMDALLIMILAEKIGDPDVLKAALAAARRGAK
ncbi:DUF2783 domain-containing protein [Oricola thermophila]|uniref:DUF2783 domain-containing protein n=1 Tax=Oricola thermophila TaxID=2742145 RepID=A0A6N1VAJ6_9HYPH|nr:DUF2783 domain-containing protein [Oricola thermophila]QKV17563.1 DUF2783 domain-containing protein [Oricola thermophila]